jgi:hypothetical protein
MRPGGGKQKGSEYERQICKALSLWVSHGAREDLFWRSAMSGGRATVGRKKGKDFAQHAGDISATHPAGHVLTDHFYVECKRYADLNFGSFLTKGVGPLAGFWTEAVKQAAAHDRIPMLIVRQDRADTMLLVPCEAMLARGLTGHVFKFNTVAWIARLMQLKIDLYDFDSVMLKDFEAPSKYSINGPFLKPGEFDKIMSARPELAAYHEKVDTFLTKVNKKRIEADKKPWATVEDIDKPTAEDLDDVGRKIAKGMKRGDIHRSTDGTKARALQGDAMMGDDAPIKRVRV